MWLLINKKTAEQHHLIPTKLEYTVGRTGTDIILRNDSSISRSHAKLLLVKVCVDDVERWHLKLQDLNSKYGTFHNEFAQSIKSTAQGLELKSGDRIRFGIIDNVWYVEYISFVTMISSLSVEDTRDLVPCVQSLGGKVVAEWYKECTHLTMTEITVTVKLLHALLEQIPVVSCSYWQDMLLAAQRFRATLPLPKNYLPKLNEALMQNHDINFGSQPERKTLFAGVTFLFMSRRHIDMYASIVRKAGGIAKDLNGNGVSKAFMIKKNVVIVQYVPTTQSQSSQTINSIADHLGTHNLRLIPEYEIGLAILHCSIEKYCNPSYKVLNDIIPATLSMDSNTPPALSDIYDTIPTKISMTLKESCVVEETDKTAENLNSKKSAKIAANNVVAATINNEEEDPTLIVERSLTRIATAMEVLEDKEQPLLGVKTFAMTASQLKRKRQTKTFLNNNEEDYDDDDDDDVDEHANNNNKNKNRNGHNDDNEDDDIPLFNLAKRANLHDRKKTTNVDIEKPTTSAQATRYTPKKMDPKPLSIEFTTRRSTRTTVNINDFTGKSSAETNKKQTTEKPQATPNKRARGMTIKVIDEYDDDDDDDLFNFGDDDDDVETAQKSKKSRYNNDGNNDDLFSFPVDEVGKRTTDVTDKAPGVVNVNSDVAKELIEAAGSQIFNYDNLPKPMPQPIMVSTVGWLSCSMQKMDVKEEDEQQQAEVTNGDVLKINEEHENVNVLPDIQVVIASNSGLKQSGGSSTRNNSCESDNSGASKNFKNFSKKFQKPQTTQRLITLVSMPVIREIKMQ